MLALWAISLRMQVYLRIMLALKLALSTKGHILVCMNKFSRAQILGLMVEGMSMRAISRITGASKNTIVKLLEDAGEAFSDCQDRTKRNLTCKRPRVAEIWAFVYAKAKKRAHREECSG